MLYHIYILNIFLPFNKVQRDGNIITSRGMNYKKCDGFHCDAFVFFLARQKARKKTDKGKMY